MKLIDFIESTVNNRLPADKIKHFKFTGSHALGAYPFAIPADAVGWDSVIHHSRQQVGTNSSWFCNKLNCTANPSNLYLPCFSLSFDIHKDTEHSRAFWQTLQKHFKATKLYLFKGNTQYYVFLNRLMDKEEYDNWINIIRDVDESLIPDSFFQNTWDEPTKTNLVYVNIDHPWKLWKWVNL
jgi:hypothetical protein